MILQELRDATAAHHRSIEKVMPLFPRIELDNYRQLLEKFWGFYAPLEEAHRHVWSERTEKLDMPIRLRTPALLKDLSYFHDIADLAHLPRCQDVPQYRGWAEFYGGLYVIEGSSLGGQLITQHLRKMGFPAEICHFFSGYGANTGKMWQGFLTELQIQVQTEPERVQAIKMAQDTFTKLEKWLRTS